MQSIEERHQLETQYSQAALGVMAVWRCAAGLALLVAVAATPWLGLALDGARTASPASVLAASAAAGDAVGESKRVFDERRERYQAAWQGVTEVPESRLVVATQAE